MIVLPAGDYPFGAGAGRQTLRLRGFAIDRTEVTNAQFAEFLNALGLRLSGEVAPGRFTARRLGQSAAAAVETLLEGAEGSGAYPLIALDDDQARIGLRAGRFEPAPGSGDHPVTETTWRGARDYCLWRGARLPTEAEWEGSARGRSGRRYPWGEAPPTRPLVHAGYATGQTAPVGSKPHGATPEGVLDLAGSLAEWTSSLAAPLPYDATDGREDPSRPGERITRGGDYVFDTSPERLVATFRGGFSRAPERGHRHIGFRCARDAP